MRFDLGPAMIGLIAVLGAGGAAAQEDLDCNDPMTQLAMNMCAYQSWQAADEDLNLAYGMAIDRAKEIDAFNAEAPIARRVGAEGTEDITTEEMLRRAQRAWIAFRDAACLVESDLARGGSMQPMLYSGCAEDLTRARTEQLRFFGELN